MTAPQRTGAGGRLQRGCRFWFAAHDGEVTTSGYRCSWTGPGRAPGVEVQSADVGARHSQPQLGWSAWTAKVTASKGRKTARPSWPTLR